MVKRFKATVAVRGSRVVVPLPFDPNATWGQKARHDITGAVQGRPVRGRLEAEGADHFLVLGPAWRRDSGLAVGDTVAVELAPEGPQVNTMPPDVAAVLNAEPKAREFFEGLPTFYRKNYMRWIESAKRPETRAKRLAEMAALLKAEKREK